jgi:hypothetical protein
MPGARSAMRSGVRHGFAAIRGEEARVRALRGVVVILFAVALGTVIKTSWHGKPHLEIIVEACSFLGALAAIAAGQRADKRASRCRALANVMRELLANAHDLASGEFMRTETELHDAMNDHGDGLRYYYSHLATTATRSAILNGALDGRADHKLVEQLNQWVHDSEACNRRFMMSELRLFSTTADETGVRERVRIHVSIVTGPAVRQRAALEKIARFLMQRRYAIALPKDVAPLAQQLAVALERFRLADAIVAELEESFGDVGEVVS